MKRVILNEILTGINGEVIVDYDYQTVQGEPRTLPMTFGRLILRDLLNQGTATDDDAMRLYGFAERINANLLLDAPTVMELSDEEFSDVKEIISGQPLIVKAKFLKMLETVAMAGSAETVTEPVVADEEVVSSENTVTPTV